MGLSIEAPVPISHSITMRLDVAVPTRQPPSIGQDVLSKSTPEHTRNLSTTGICSLRQKSLIIHKMKLSTTTMSFDTHIHENFAIQFSISSPLGDPLGKLNKVSYLLDAKHLLALSTPSADEPLQHTIVDDCIEVIQDLIVCPLLEQEFMSTMGLSNRVQRIQQLAESSFTLLAKAEAVTSAAGFLEAIQGFCAWATCPAAVNVHNILTGNTGPPIMELELQFTHWHFAPTWNGRHLDDIIPPSDHLALRLEPSHAVEPSAHPLDEGKDVSPVLNSPLECLAPDPLLSPSSIDVPTSAVDQVPSPTVSNLDQGKATPPTASPTMTSLAAASSMPNTLCFQSSHPPFDIAPIQSQVFHLFSPGCRGNHVPPDKPLLHSLLWGQLKCLSSSSPSHSFHPNLPLTRFESGEGVRRRTDRSSPRSHTPRHCLNNSTS